MSKSTQERLSMLGEMLGQAGAMHYKRITLAKEILDDKTWVMLQYKGDQIKAAEALEKTYFGDLCGAISIWRLLKIIEDFPNIKDWEARKFNLTAMSAEIDSRNKRSKSGDNRWSVTKREYEEVESEKDKLQRVVAQKVKEIEAKDAELKKQKELIERLTKDKARLEGRVQELEAFIKHFNLKKPA